MIRYTWKKKILLMLLSAVLLVQPGGMAMADSLSDAQQEKEELENALNEAEKLIDDLKGSKDNIQSKVTQLDKQLTQISTDITNLEVKLEEKNAQIAVTSEELEAAQEEEKTQYESMKVRIRYMYQNSRGSYITKILSAKSFGDFLNTVEYISSITEYDRDMLLKYQETQNTVANAKSSLESDKTELQQMQAKVEEEKKAVSALLNEKETQLAGVSDNLDQAADTADVFEAEIQAQNDIIAQIQAAEAAKKAAREAAAAAAAEEAAKAAAQQQNSTEVPAEGATESEQAGANTPAPVPVPEEPDYNGGAFTWPCPSSTRITSEYGNRLSPTAGASSNHKGIDIGAAYGADIVAAADGKVIFAGYSSSSGNYVMIDHGGSLYTVYMHASSLSVSTGNSVSKGQVVAKVGSTGISTGNHLHFGVSLNGSYVSPWNYLSK